MGPLIAACVVAFLSVTGAGLAGKQSRQAADGRKKGEAVGWYVVAVALLAVTIVAMAVAAVASLGYGGGGVFVFAVLGVCVNAMGLFVNWVARLRIMWLALIVTIVIVGATSALPLLHIDLAPKIAIWWYAEQDAHAPPGLIHG